MTLKANICSVRVPSVPVWSRHWNSFQSATMQCHFGQSRNGSMVTHFIHFSTATSSATSEYVTVPERIDQSEESDKRNEERTKNKPSSVPKIHLNDVQWNHMYTCSTCSYEFPLIFYLIWWLSFKFSYYGENLWPLFVLIFIVSTRE